jgi:type II secretory pathway pseudopilin PulG
MYLEGQAGQRGYAMAALLMSVAVMAIVMSALLPVWRQQSQREKEAELAFRGEQYARAIALFQAKNGNLNPPSIDALVQGRYLRKKYKDPMTEDGEFQPLAAGTNQPGPQGGSQGGSQGGGSSRGSASIGAGSNPNLGAGNSGRGSSTVSGNPIGGGSSQGRGTPNSGLGGQNPGRGGPSPGLGGGNPGGVQGGGGILRVVSKSKEASIRIYYGASHYNEWQFMYNRQGRGGAGSRGGPGGGPTQGRPGTGAPGGGAQPGGTRGGGPAGGARGGGPGRGVVPGGRGGG